jgi:transglutaminase-like putative cysteine protease
MIIKTCAVSMILFIVIMFSVSVMAYFQYPDFDGNNTYELAYNIDTWARYNPNGANITYEMHNMPQLPEETLYTKKGDCTDIALLTVSLLKGYHIQTRLVSGYAYGVRHDWYEFKDDNNTWVTFEDLDNLTIIRYDKVW